MARFTGLIGQRELLSYVDPHPGKKGSDLVAGDCPRCGGYGFISAFGHVQMGRCFKCGGNGAQNVTVATVRKHARAAAYARDFAVELAAHRNAVAEAARVLALAEEAAAQAAAEVAEAARLASLVQGFVAPVGDKVAGLAVTIKVAKYLPGSYNRSSAMFVIAEAESGQVLKFVGAARSVMDLQRGDQAVIVTGKVKAHEEYDGQEQTVLSHVKVEVIDQEEEQAA